MSLRSTREELQALPSCGVSNLYVSLLILHPVTGVSLVPPALYEQQQKTKVLVFLTWKESERVKRGSQSDKISNFFSLLMWWWWLRWWWSFFSPRHNFFFFFFFWSSYTSTSQGGVIIPERAVALFLSWGSEKSCCQCLSKVWHGGGPRLWASPQSAVITLGPAAAVSRCASLHAYIQQRHPLFFFLFFPRRPVAGPAAAWLKRKETRVQKLKGHYVVLEK